MEALKDFYLTMGAYSLIFGLAIFGIIGLYLLGYMIYKIITKLLNK